MQNEYDFYSSRSGLTPPERYSLSDHQLAYWSSLSGTPSSDGIARAMDAYYGVNGEYAFLLAATGLPNTTSLAGLRANYYANPPVSSPSAARLFDVVATTP